MGCDVRPHIDCSISILTCPFHFRIFGGSGANPKTISDRASVHKGITNFGAVFTTERRCAASILKVNRHVSDRFGPFLFTLCRSVFHVGKKSGSV